jgi:hypothetical protein
MRSNGNKSKTRFHGKLGILFVSALMIVGAGVQVLSGSSEGGTPQTGDGKTVWDGVYTEAQSTAGEAVYGENCSVCHGEAASGQSGPQLYGEGFFGNWREDTVRTLYSHIRSNMPRRKPPLSDPDYLIVTAYILKENGFPAGSDPLSTASMGAVRIEGKEGPEPLPPNSLVQVTGCLTSDGGDWTLTMASQPSRNRNPDPDRSATPEEVEVARSESTGELTFSLTNFFMLGDFDPSPHDGHKMLARGALIRRPSGDRISLTGLDMVARGCGS